MVCEKLSEGICKVLNEYCEKPYEFKMGIKLCPVIKGKSKISKKLTMKKTKKGGKVEGKRKKMKKKTKKK